MLFLSLAIPTLLGIFYQFYLRDILFDTIGIYRDVQRIEEFPYVCRAIQHESLQACEDLWLDEEARRLYAACSSVDAHTQWCPSMNRFNNSNIKAGGDHISVLEIDHLDDNNVLDLSRLEIVDYHENLGSESPDLHLHGFDVEVLSDSKLRFYLINHRAPMQASGDPLDPFTVGANSTVEVFDVHRGQQEMSHVRTIVSGAIFTPNNLVSTGDGGVIVTNDHSAKVGIRRKFDHYIGGGNIAYCNSSECKLSASVGFNSPNGIVKGKDGLYYIPSSVKDRIRVMKLQPDQTLQEVHVIRLGMPVDNMSVDSNGDIYAAGFPKILEVLRAFNDPWKRGFASTIWRIRRIPGDTLQYDVEKILEDKDARHVRGATVARHDVKTGRLFISGVVAPWITVCDPIV